MTQFYNPEDPELARILSERSGPARPRLELLTGKIKDRLRAGESCLDEVNGSPVLRAKIAIPILLDIATTVAANLSPAELAGFWSEKDRADCISAVGTLKSAFSLNSDVLQGFRERDPEFVFHYLLLRELFFGRLPVIASDLKDTLATFVQASDTSVSGQPGADAGAGFPGVKAAIEDALKLGQFFIVTGDSHHTVVNNFLKPNSWVLENEDGSLLPASDTASRLVWLPRTGMEVACSAGPTAAFRRSPLINGIRETEQEAVRETLQRVFEEMKIAEHFAAPGRQYACRQDSPPGTIEIRKGGDGDDFSVAFYPAGILEKSSRDKFRADPANAVLLEKTARRLQEEFNAAGLGHIIAKRGGLSTIDLVTSDKGHALVKIQQTFLHANEMLVFIGDRIALNGNDVEAISVADVSVQVGNEWDGELFPQGNRTLLRSKQTASEGGAAEYIADATLLRHLGMTGILSPRHPQMTNGRSETSAGPEQPVEGETMPLLPPMDTSLLIDEARRLSSLLISSEAPAHSAEPELARLAGDLAEILGRIPDSDPVLLQQPFARFEILLLKRVVAGWTPVLSSDLKDTLAVFDSNAVEWFPEVYAAFDKALRQGPYFLMTGDSLANLQDRFLLKAGIVEKIGGNLISTMRGIHNLHLITRTGLDRVIFNFAIGELERLPLVAGIERRKVDLIRDVLDDTTVRFHCADNFAGYKCESARPPGFVDVRGEDFGDRDASFAFFPAGVLLKEERPRFRAEMMGGDIFLSMVAHIRKELHKLGFENVLVQQGGISTIDITTTTKGTALAQLRKNLLGPREFLVYLGDTVTQRGNDGSTIGVAEFTVQVGAERDDSLNPPPGHVHIHSPIHARQGGTAAAINLTVQARKLASMGLWNSFK